MKKILFPLLFLAPLFAGAQIDTSALSFTFSGYAEPYYGYDFGEPESGNRPGFVYSHNRHNEFSLNIAYLKGSVNAQRFRGNLALMAGTYANANLASMPFVDEAVKSDPSIFPPPEVMAKLFTTVPYGPQVDRAITRLWTKVRTGQ